MARLFKYQQTAVILALAAMLLASPLAVGPASAGTIGGGGGSTDPQAPGDGKGDPDVPATGPSRTNLSGAQQVATPSYETPTVGDGRVPVAVWSRSAWAWRLRIVLQGLRAYTFRF